MQEIKYIAIQNNFSEFKTENVKTAKLSPNNNHLEFDGEIAGSVFELLEKDECRVYVDIEKIPLDKPDLIKDIVTKLGQFIGIKRYNFCAITKNIGSHHEGLSYHVYFPYKSPKTNIYNMIRQFKLKYPEFAEYIDESVYTKNRLFRLPNQIGVTSNSVKTYPNGYDKRLDRHIIIYGNYVSTIIQNLRNLETLKTFEPVQNKEMENKHVHKAPVSGNKVEAIEDKIANLEDMVSKLAKLIETKLTNK